MKLSLCLGSICLLLACNPTKKKGDIETIDFAKNMSSFVDFPLSSIAESVKYIPLETSKECVIGHINLLFLEDDTIIVSGYNFCKSFDLEGRFISDIGKTGKGPGEYTYVSELSIDHLTNTLYISCEKKIETYTLNGRFKGTVHLPDQADSKGLYLGSNVFCSITPVQSGNEEKSLVFFNSNSTVLNITPNYHKFKREDKYISSEDQGKIQSGYGNEYYYKGGICDTIFRIEEKLLLTPLFYLDRGKYRMPLDIISGTRDNYLSTLNNYILLKDYVVLKNGICFTFHFNKYLKENDSKSQQAVVFGKHVDFRPTTVAGYFNKQNSEMIFLKSTYGFIGFRNDLDGGLPFWPRSMGSKNEMLCWYSAEDIKESLTKEQIQKAAAKDAKAKEQLLNIINTLDPSDNPVIVVMNIK